MLLFKVTYKSYGFFFFSCVRYWAQSELHVTCRTGTGTTRDWLMYFGKLFYFPPSKDFDV